MLMRRGVVSSRVGNGVFQALLVLVLVVLFNAFRFLSDNQKCPMLQVDFVTAMWIDSNEMSV